MVLSEEERKTLNLYIEGKLIHEYNPISLRLDFINGLKLVELMERNFNCSNVCQLSLFYMNLDLTNGVPD